MIRSWRHGTEAFYADDDGGFTLLEILVSLVLLSVALIVVFQLFSANTKALALSGDYVAATVKAESKMREVLDIADEDIEEGSKTERTDDGYTIDINIAETLEKRTEELPIQLMEVSVTVHWKKFMKEKSLTLRTVKLVTRKV